MSRRWRGCAQICGVRRFIRALPYTTCTLTYRTAHRPFSFWSGYLLVKELYPCPINPPMCLHSAPLCQKLLLIFHFQVMLLQLLVQIPPGTWLRALSQQIYELVLLGVVMSTPGCAFLCCSTVEAESKPKKKPPAHVRLLYNKYDTKAEQNQCLMGLECVMLTV